LAQTQLQGIQAMLPESSVARLRAESWFAHQTGDVDSASRIYRRLLEKVPGDELSSVNLAAIEKKRQRPDQAKEVLAKALRQNPSSSVLRSAIDQLAQSEVRP
jgi:predicted Zn-dependent protease